MTRRPKDWIFLYVPQTELEEALYLGAVRVEGDARLVVPNPLPPGATVEAFDRWRTPEAAYAWCYGLVQGILSNMVDLKSENGRRREVPIEIDMAPRMPDKSLAELSKDGAPTMSDIMAQLGKAAAENDRIYLYPTAEEAPALRAMEGVRWDRRKRVYYAVRGADLNKLFKYMTPAAQKAWQGQRTATRATDWLTQDMARAEVARRAAGTSGGTGGGPAKTIPGEAAKAAARKVAGIRES